MKQVQIRVSLTSTILLLILALATALLLVNVRAGQEIAEALGGRFLEKTEDLVEARLNGFFHPVVTTLDGCRAMARDGVMTPADHGRSNAVYRPILAAYRQITSLATGDETGYSYRIGADDKNYKVRITPAGPLGPKRVAAYHILDPAGRVLESYEEETGFEPRARPWYVSARAALAAAGSVAATPVSWTDPFILNTSKNPGIAAALPFEGPDGVPYMMTFNLMLTKMSDFTASLRPTPQGKAFVLARDDEGQLRVIGFPQDDRYPDSAARVELIKSLDNRMPALGELGHPALAAAEAVFLEAEQATARHAARIEVDGKGWRLAFRPYPLQERAGEPTPSDAAKRLWVGVAVPEADMLGPVLAQRRRILWVSGLALLGAAVVAWLLSRVYGEPLRRLAAHADRLTQLDLEAPDPVDTHVVETHRLAESHERMRDALVSFARYVPTGVVRQLLRRGEAAALGGADRDVTLLFTDVRGFTTISERMAPGPLTEHMAVYFGALMEIIERHAGAIDKMIGDAIMALFGAPNEDPDHARHALEAVLEMRAWLADFNARCVQDDLPPLHTGMGLASGRAFVGNIGARERLNYTALGDTVNLASRLEGVTKQLGAEVLCSEDHVARCGEGFVWRLVDRVAVKGRAEPLGVHEPLGRVGEVSAERLAFGAAYERAFALYQARDFDGALRVLTAMPEAGTDASVDRLVTICRAYAEDPPPPDWDGVVRLLDK